MVGGQPRGIGFPFENNAAGYCSYDDYNDGIKFRFVADFQLLDNVRVLVGPDDVDMKEYRIFFVKFNPFFWHVYTSEINYKKFNAFNGWYPVLHHMKDICKQEGLVEKWKNKSAEEAASNKRSRGGTSGAP